MDPGNNARRLQKSIFSMIWDCSPLLPLRYHRAVQGCLSGGVHRSLHRAPGRAQRSSAMMTPHKTSTHTSPKRWRLRIPVLLAIHSSDVSTRLSSSEFGITWSCSNANRLSGSRRPPTSCHSTAWAMYVEEPQGLSRSQCIERILKCSCSL